MSKIPAAIQLYSLREETEKDFLGTLKKVAELGYEGVEFAGYGGLEAFEIKREMDKLGLKAAGTHVQLAELEKNLDNVIAYQKVLGNKHIICPMLTEAERADLPAYEKTAKKIAKIAQKVAEEGFVFSYHNHDFELLKTEGTTPLELLLNTENVHAELDVYWLTKAGESPIEWLENYAHKTPLVHLKDMTTDEEQYFAELGTGGIDVMEIIKLSEAIGVEWLIVEQDDSRIGAMESAEVSMEYLKENYY